MLKLLGDAAPQEVSEWSLAPVSAVPHAADTRPRRRDRREAPSGRRPNERTRNGRNQPPTSTKTLTFWSFPGEAGPVAGIIAG